MFQPKRILVPMDFSDEAKLALDWAFLLAQQMKAGAIFPTYVFSPVVSLVGVDTGLLRYQDVTQHWVEEEMKGIQARLSTKVECEPLYGTGNPAIEILGLCQRKRIDLIVTTTHGRHGISHLLHGSVAESLVRDARCPVLVLHLSKSALEPVHGDDAE